MVILQIIIIRSGIVKFRRLQLITLIDDRQLLPLYYNQRYLKNDFLLQYNL